VSANLDLVRSIYADWERGELRRVDWADPAIEFVTPDGAEPGRWHGLGGMTTAFRRFLTEWEDFTVKVDEARELDDGRVLILVSHTGRGRTSGIDLARVGGGANLLEIRDGKVIQITAYWDRTRALADLDLEG
jgi:ketosteroid isomerase-like protein